MNTQIGDNLPMGSTIYIAGPMRGHRCFNFSKFFHYEELFRRSGYKVINPAALDVARMMNGWRYDEDKYEEVLTFDLAVIEHCADALFLMEGWEESEGATREKNKAEELGIPYFLETERL